MNAGCQFIIFKGSPPTSTKLTPDFQATSRIMFLSQRKMVYPDKLEGSLSSRATRFDYVLFNRLVDYCQEKHLAVYLHNKPQFTTLIANIRNVLLLVDGYVAITDIPPNFQFNDIRHLKKRSKCRAKQNKEDLEKQKNHLVQSMMNGAPFLGTAAFEVFKEDTSMVVAAIETRIGKMDQQQKRTKQNRTRTNFNPKSDLAYPPNLQPAGQKTTGGFSIRANFCVGRRCK
jgi:hypothetical protein